MLRLYDSRFSGNCWKVRILLNQLGIPIERVTLDLAKGEAADASFQQKSRFGRVPALELEDGRTLVESAAILLYLAEGTRFIPEDLFLRAEMLGWLFFEQADLQKPIATPRVYHLRGLAAEMADEIARFQKDGNAALAKLEHWLDKHTWLVGERYTLADLAVSCYVSLAGQGGYDMARYPAIQAWTARVSEQPGWVPLLSGE
ncbi:Disulfide-bond oxidoreductase YfcG [Variovorax sp. PBL-H6]|uniref:glutathione S-transferase family protein n=1 Tax=Variovorax sp. PBL-H6 TaxID=434009 RepID=UPI001318DB28|nr:glutathione S-transferase family protein [Variovorax sp. PBL-H6]VTU19340.1 Disulfide-bond oxidoreductase YfcG [Variovorax sp. PBL-H6]